MRSQREREREDWHRGRLGRCRCRRPRRGSDEECENPAWSTSVPGMSGERPRKYPFACRTDPPSVSVSFYPLPISLCQRCLSFPLGLSFCLLAISFSFFGRILLCSLTSLIFRSKLAQQLKRSRFFCFSLSLNALYLYILTLLILTWPAASITTPLFFGSDVMERLLFCFFSSL